jgi:hypothetical protein
MNNNEPVAWMSTSGNNFVSKKAPSYAHIGTDGWIPLYTHPAKTLTDKEIQNQSLDNLMAWQQELDKAKTLTDEEIEAVHNSQDFYNDWEMFSYKDFARAILRKAQEK